MRATRLVRPCAFRMTGRAIADLFRRCTLLTASPNAGRVQAVALSMAAAHDLALATFKHLASAKYAYTEQ